MGKREIPPSEGVCELPMRCQKGKSSKPKRRREDLCSQKRKEKAMYACCGWVHSRIGVHLSICSHPCRLTRVCRLLSPQRTRTPSPRERQITFPASVRSCVWLSRLADALGAGWAFPPPNSSSSHLAISRSSRGRQNPPRARCSVHPSGPSHPYAGGFSTSSLLTEEFATADGKTSSHVGGFSRSETPGACRIVCR